MPARFPGSAARFLLVLVCLGALGGAFAYWQARAPKPELAAGDAHAPDSRAAIFATPRRHGALGAATQANPLVAPLLDATHVTPERAVLWKDNLKRLVAQGRGALPAIQGFLDKNLDINFAAAENGAQMGFP